MKQIILVLWLLILHFNMNAQIVNPSGNTVRSDDYEKYIKKSKGQKTAAWIMLGGGTVMGVTGLVIGINNITLFGGEPNTESKIGGAMFFAGALSMVGSVPFFISSGVNKRKARVLLKNEHVKIGHKYLPGSNYTAVSISIPIGR
ncbi:MAG TPA: hypothetical protein PKE30_04230 [Niabella sp.]|nr:hypothetical protein [Niabella sp.]